MLEGNENLKKFLNLNLLNLRYIVLWGEEIMSTENRATLMHPSLAHVVIYDFDTFLRLGSDHGRADDIGLEQRRTEPGHCASLVYTSGTTGPPKACMVIIPKFLNR